MNLLSAIFFLKTGTDSVKLNGVLIVQKELIFPIKESFTFAEMVAAVVLAQWHTNEAVWRKAEPRECNIVISDTEPESLLQYDVNGMRRHRSQPFMGFLDCRECYMRYSSSSRRRIRVERVEEEEKIVRNGIREQLFSTARCALRSPSTC